VLHDTHLFDNTKIFIHPRSHQLLRKWFVVFYLNQIGVHNNQLMLLPQNWYDTGYIVIYIHCTVLQLQKKFIQWCKHLIYVNETRRRNVVLPSKSNSVISWKQVTNFDVFCHNKSHIRELELKHQLRMSDIDFQFYEDQKGMRIGKCVQSSAV